MLGSCAARFILDWRVNGLAGGRFQKIALLVGTKANWKCSVRQVWLDRTRGPTWFGFQADVVSDLRKIL